MGFFFSSEPKVTRREFEHLRGRMRSRGFSERNIKDVRMIFRGALDERQESQRGIDEGEIAEGIRWMRENGGIHSLSEKEIDTLDALLKEEL